MQTKIQIPQEERNIFALIFRFDPEARKCYSQLKRLGVSKLRLDYMLVRNAGGSYDRRPDPGAWVAHLERWGYASAIRSDDGWSIHS